MSQWALSEFLCAACGRFEQIVSRPVPDAHACPDCGELAEWVISAPKPKADSVPCYATVRGGDLKDRPPGMLDTRPLGEGQSMTEWRKTQDKAREERNYQRLKKMGAISPKVVVG